MCKGYGYSVDAKARETITMRYKRIMEAVNRRFWNYINDAAHSLYVGSYGRGTAINTSDIDILMLLPDAAKKRFDAYAQNGQSAILQVVKDSIRETYATSDIRADGQVVKIFFVNGMKFEVVPAFKNRWPARDFTYSDVNMGGRWLSTNPKAEQDAMDSKNKETNGSLKNPCKRIRYIRDAYYKSYHLSGIIIDSFVYDAIGRSQWPDEYLQLSRPLIIPFQGHRYCQRRPVADRFKATDPLWSGFEHGLSVPLPHVELAGVDPYRVVHDAVEDGVGDGVAAETAVPFLGGQLGRERGAGVVVAQFHELKQEAPELLSGLSTSHSSIASSVYVEYLRTSLAGPPGLRAAAATCSARSGIRM